jgi:hypothetical protein
VSQTIIVPLVNLGIALPLTYYIARYTPPAFGSSRLSYYGLLLLVPFLGFCLGYAACAWNPSLYATAKHVWVFPAALTVLFSLFAEVGDIRDRALAFIAPDFPLLIFTWPVSSCCSYSLGALTAHWSRRRSDKPLP